MLAQVGVIVVDEAQMIANASRGANLEFILTLIRMRRGAGLEPQIVALSAVIGDTGGLESWPDAIEEASRGCDRFEKGIDPQRLTGAEHQR